MREQQQQELSLALEIEGYKKVGPRGGGGEGGGL
jgi:hypothetical protein